jgi:hypothetical protein
MRKLWFLFFVLLSGVCHVVAQVAPIEIHWEEKYTVPFNEPSDIIFQNGKFIICGDKAFVYSWLPNTQPVQLSVSDFDIEAVCSVQNKLYLSEETYQRIIEFDLETNKTKRQFPFKHFGGRNEGIESLTYNENENAFYLCSEKDPCIFYKADSHFQVLEQFQIPGISEVSSMTFFNGQCYVLSDEASQIFLVNLNDYSIQRSWQLNLLNPEGICFDDKGNCWIVSDDMAMIFKYKLP